MKFSRDKSLLLAALALLAPLPLPFNEVVGWGSVAAYVLVVGVFLKRTLDGQETVLPYWAMNVLGLLYLPFLFLDLTVLRQGRILQPLVHLAMFALVVKLFAMHREKDKWHVLLTVFFVFVASAGTSVHPSIFPYMVLFLSLGILVLIRFSGMHTVAEVVPAEARLPRVPVRGFIAWTVLLVIVGAAPLFFLMPRLRRPYVWAPTAGSGSSVQISGFSDRLDLDVIGRVRSSRTVVLRYSYATQSRFPSERRFKVSVFEHFEEGTWRRAAEPVLPINRSSDGLYYLGADRPVAWMDVWQRTSGRGSMILPVEARAVDSFGSALALTYSGSVAFVFPPPSTAEYRVGVGPSPFIASAPPAIADQEIDLAGVSPEISELAAEVAGQGTAIEKIRRVESHLLDNYSYTLDLRGQPTDRPVERFLFETREGHCEYFVSAMVLMLRSQGIPARVANGYLGADYNDWQDYFIVRQSHAHAWVEAWVEEAGWQIFDPTPADGRPVAERTGLGALLEQAWDAMLFRWDRYVLTYGFSDQVGAFIRLRELMNGLWSFFGKRGSGSTGDAAPKPSTEQPAAVEGEESQLLRPQLVQLVPFVLMGLAVAVWLWWRRQRFTATHAYRLLRSRLQRAAPEATQSTPPLEVERLMGVHAPTARSQTRRVVELYLEESFGGRELEADELAEVRGALKETGKLWRRAGLRREGAS